MKRKTTPGWAMKLEHSWTNTLETVLKITTKDWLDYLIYSDFHNLYYMRRNRIIVESFSCLTILLGVQCVPNALQPWSVNSSIFLGRVCIFTFATVIRINVHIVSIILFLEDQFIRHQFRILSTRSLTILIIVFKL